MKLPNVVGRPYTLATVLMLGWTLTPHAAPAGIPSGQWQIQVSNATNHVWDVSHIAQLQSPVAEFLDDDTTVFFEAPFSQDGSGKLAGAGATDIEVASPILTGSVAGEYVARGTISSAKGIARLTFSSRVKGSVIILGQVRTVSSSFAVKAALDSLTQTTSGSYASTATAAGYGTLKDSGAVDFTWDDVVAAMGEGAWSLHMNLTNDLVKRVGGTATVVVSGGRTLGFTAKGTYNLKTDSTLLILMADADSKGSSLKVTLSGSGSAALQGKLTGQTIKAVGTLEPD